MKNPKARAFGFFAPIVTHTAGKNSGHLGSGGRRLFAKGLKKKRGRKEVRKT
jgi:hypothetical protein